MLNTGCRCVDGAAASMDEENDTRLPRNCDGRLRREKVVTEEGALWLVTLVTAVAVASGNAAVDAAVVPTRSSGQFRSLLWASALNATGVPGCTATLLTAEWALLAAGCVPSGTEEQLSLYAPRLDDHGIPEENGNEPEVPKQWSQRRRVVEVVMAPNEDREKGAAPFPAVALVRTESPFALGTLQPASLLWGPLQDDRRPLRCSVAGWDVVGEEKKAESVYPSDLTWVPIGRVMTYSQCAENAGLVERDSQFCVEVVVPAPGVEDAMEAVGAHFNATEEAKRAIQRRGLIGNPLLCIGAVAGVRFLRSGMPGLSAVQDPSSLHYRIDVFTNATHLEPWIRKHVKDISVISTDGGLVVATDTATHAPPFSTRRSHGARSFGRSDATSQRGLLTRAWHGLLAACVAAVAVAQRPL